MNRWPTIQPIVRDVVTLLIGVYLVWRTTNPPPITYEDMPGLVAAAGFLGVPFKARAE